MKFMIVEIERELVESYEEKHTITLVSCKHDSDADLIREAFISGKEVSITITEPKRKKKEGKK